MRRTLVALAACALLAPLAAQETKTTTAPTVSPNTTVRTGPATRVTRRGGEVMVVQGTAIPGTMTRTTTINGVTTTTTMEPVFNHRGRVTGYREVATPTVAKTETKTTTENPVKQTGNTEKSVEKTETKTVTTPTTEPMPERRRGVLSRIFRR